VEAILFLKRLRCAEYCAVKPHLRAQVIAEWRGLPDVPFPQDTSKPIGALIGKLIAELGLGTRLREEEIMAAWSDIVGDFIAQHSTPQRLADGILYVRVLQPSMHFELERTMRTEILRKLKLRFGKSVRDLKFRVC
jgi:predicted nucleic acid-binding Zn ribbon protein